MERVEKLVVVITKIILYNYLVICIIRTISVVVIYCSCCWRRREKRVNLSTLQEFYEIKKEERYYILIQPAL